MMGLRGTYLSRWSMGIVVVLSVACVSTKQQLRIYSVDFAQEAALALPAPRDTSQRILATQVLTGRYAERTFTMQLELEWTEHAIVVAALGSFGAALFTISFDGERFQTEGSRLLLDDLDVRYVLADLLLVFLDEAQLRSVIRGRGLVLRQRGLLREVSRYGATLVRIRYSDEDPWVGAVFYENSDRGYALEIRTVEVIHQ